MFDATIGGTTANSYITVEDANDYFALRLYAQRWDDAMPIHKEAALVMATAVIDRMVKWYGAPASDEQRLSFPRIHLYDRWGREVTGAEIPVDVRDAVCEQALDLLFFNSTRIPDNLKKGIASSSAGEVSATMDSNMVSDRLAPYAYDILRNSQLGVIVPGAVKNMTGTFNVTRG